MARTLLFVMLAVAFIAGISYRLMQGKEAEGANPAPMGEMAPAPEAIPAVSPAPTTAAPTDDDEDSPKPASPSREKFESDEDIEDTDDGLTIEVEEEE